MKALLIEDNPIYQIKLRNLINSLGYEVKITSSVRESVAYLKTEVFNLLVCDIVLSDGEFFDIDSVPFVPTIILTAYENPVYLSKALNINNSLFLVKPFSDLSFIAAVRRVTDKIVNVDDKITVFGKHKNPIDLKVSEIEAIDSQGNYSAIFTTRNEKHIVKRSAKKIIDNVLSPVFVRIQRSTYVNKSQITRVSFSDNKIFTRNKEFAVSKVFKKNIYEFHHLSN